MRAYVWRSAVVFMSLGALIAVFNPSYAFIDDSRRDTSVVYGDCLTTAQTFAVTTKAVTSRRNGEVTRLPEKISFVQRKAGCVLVAFTAEINATGSGLQLWALLDDSVPSMPETARLMTGQSVNAHGMNFVFTNVPAGRHTLQFDFAAVGTVNPVVLQARSTIVSYTR